MIKLKKGPIRSTSRSLFVLCCRGIAQSFSGSPFNTLGIAVDIGTVSSTSEPVVYALGVVRDPAIRYTNGLVQIEERSSYYWSQFTNIHDVVCRFVGPLLTALFLTFSLGS